MRFFSLLTAALCGALGAAWVLTSASPAWTLGDQASLTAWLSPAVELGVGREPQGPRGDAAATQSSWDQTARRADFVERAAQPVGSVTKAPFPPAAEPAWPTSPLATWSGEQPPTAPIHWSNPREEAAEAGSTRPPEAPLLLAQTPSATERTRVGSRTASGWVVVAQSVEGRPIHLKTLGAGSRKILVVAGIDGEDRIAVNWIDAFVQQLSQAPLHRDLQLLIVRAANPDGLTARHVENARGVALNRNFPTAHYRPGGRPSAGTGPASEPETRALMQLLYDHRPQRLVHVISSSTPSRALCNGVAQDAAESLQDTAGVSVETFDPAAQGGSLEDFAASVLGIEVVSLRLEIGEDWRAAAVANYPRFLAAAIPLALRGEMELARHAVKRLPGTAGEDTPVSAQTVAPITRRSQSGYEELPPPPHKRGF